jgi:pimeloyl-ACP methyl ester carboxylesterase
MSAAFESPRSRDVTVEGVRLHLLEWGDPDAPVLIVLHGFTGHAWQAELVAPALVPTHRVIALDQRGHGDSDRAEIYGSAPMGADVIGVLDALGIERAVLVGHSMGGTVAVAVTALHPERVVALVLGDIGPEVGSEGAARIQRNTRSRDVFEGVDDAVATQTELNPTANPDALRHRVAHNLVEEPDGSFTWKYDRALRDGSARYEGYARDEQWAFLAAIRVPVLLIRGELSDILSEEIADRMLATIPDARMVTISGAGHSIATDAPAAVAAAIADFVSSM